MFFEKTGTLFIEISFACNVYFGTRALVLYVTWKNMKWHVTIGFK